ncbi:phosphatase PAP2 family protein [Falsibacillus albus]|nr:phosphatase PAP2 family protein [Falsibacillus albus]
MSIAKKRATSAGGAILLLLLFFLLAWNYHNPYVLSVSNGIQGYLYDSLNQFGSSIFIGITRLGSGYVSFPLTGILAIYLIIKRKPWIALLLIYNLMVVRLFNRFLKTVYAFPRPTLKHMVDAGYYSFPSGHSMNSIAFYGFLGYLAANHFKQKGKSTRLIWTVTSILIFLIGMSRIYLGVHFPTDVIGGFLAGGATLLVTILISTLRPLEQRQHAN